MVDLDSNPTKLIEVVHIGKQMLMTRGSLTTFSIANDVAKYFAIIPAAFAATYPQLNALNVMHLHSPASAILSAVIFNALIIVFLIPLALKGVSYKPLTAAAMLRRNLWIYGLAGWWCLSSYQGYRPAVDAVRPGLKGESNDDVTPAILLFILLSLITGGLYPLVTTALDSGGLRIGPTAR